MEPQSSSEALRVFAANLVRIRAERGMTQEELAHAAGIDKSHVGYFEQLRNSPTLDTIAKIANGLGVPVAEMLTEQQMEGEDDIELARLNALLPFMRRYQELADEYGIDDVFQDNGGKLLQTLILTGLQNLPGREGNDAIDNEGWEWELKTVNQRKVIEFSTHHHLTVDILAKYRRVRWLFCVYEAIEIVEIWILEPEQMEPLFQFWEQKLAIKQVESKTDKLAHINNQKIRLSYVRETGRLYYRDKADDKLKPAKKLASFQEKFKKPEPKAKPVPKPRKPRGSKADGSQGEISFNAPE